MQPVAHDTALNTPYACLCDVLSYAKQSILPHHKDGDWEIGWHAWYRHYSTHQDLGLNACLAGLQGALILFVKTKLGADHDRDEDTKKKACQGYKRQFFQFRSTPLYEVLPTLQLKSAAAMALVSRIDALLQMTDEQLAIRDTLPAELAEVAGVDVADETTETLTETLEEMDEIDGTDDRTAVPGPAPVEDADRQADRRDAPDGRTEDAVQGQARSGGDIRIRQALPQAHGYSAAR